MEITELLKNSYENLGFAVLSIEPVPGTYLYDVEFIGADGPFKRKVVAMFAIIYEPPEQGNECNQS
jgi:hypothetical protein